MQKILAAETWTVQPSGTADTRVFNSSKELFLALKRQYKRASALNMSAVMYDLLQKVSLCPRDHALMVPRWWTRTPQASCSHTRVTQVWSKHLKSYAKKVQEHLPPIKQPADPSQPPECNLDEPMQRVVCAVVNTGEYCAATTEGCAARAC